MTADEIRKKLLEENGVVDEAQVIELVKQSRPLLYNIEEQREVLKRMKERGAKPCEIRNQELWIKGLEESW